MLDNGCPVTRGSRWLAAGLGLWQLLLPAALLFPAAACYKYVPLEEGNAALARGDGMRVALSRPIAVDLGEITVNDAVLVTGEFIERESDGTIVLAAFETKSVTGADRSGSGLTLRIPAAAVAAVERKSFNGGATALVIIPIVGGAIAIGAVALSDGGSGGGNGNGGIPEVD